MAVQLLNLPMEMLVEICQHLDPEDIPFVRYVCKTLLFACNTAKISFDPYSVLHGLGASLQRIQFAFFADIHRRDLLGYAAFYGSFESVKWLRSKRMPLHPKVCSQAAHSGHLKLLKWLRNRGCRWNEYTCSKAAAGGHLNVLEWARTNDCPWDSELYSEAAAGGHLHVLKWALANGCSLGNKSNLSKAIQNNQLEAVQWGIANNCQLTYVNVYDAVCSKNIQMLSLIVARYYWFDEQDSLTEKIIEKMGEIGNLDMLKIVYENILEELEKYYRAPIDIFTKSESIDDIDRLSYVNKRFDVLGYAAPYAAAKGHFHILKWLFSMKFLTPERTITSPVFEACNHGQLDIVEWAGKNNFSFTSDSIEEFSRNTGEDIPTIIKSFLDKKYRMKPCVFRKIIEIGDTDLAKAYIASGNRVKDYFSYGDATFFAIKLDSYVKNGSRDMINILASVFPDPGHSILYYALVNGDQEILESWLKQNNGWPSFHRCYILNDYDIEDLWEFNIGVEDGELTNLEYDSDTPVPCSGCPANDESILQILENNGHQKLMKWAIQNGCRRTEREDS